MAQLKKEIKRLSARESANARQEFLNTFEWLQLIIEFDPYLSKIKILLILSFR
jgi:hypothetical protein